MSYEETIDYLFTAMPSFQNVGGDAYKPGLERIREFCQRLDNPQLKYFVVHIAGTNGKGSTSHMLASVLQTAGWSVGLFTSPHLRDFRERIRINGEMISQNEVVAFVDQHKESMESLSLSFFEMTAAMAFDHFARNKVEVAIIETGLGGRLDATNIVEPQLTVITNIGIDHTKYLGTTIEQIATEKAGIIKSGVPIILGESNEEYNTIIEHKAKEVGAKLIYAEKAIKWLSTQVTKGGQLIQFERQRDRKQYGAEIDLRGEYQSHNLITASAVLDHINRHSPLTVSTQSFLDGLRNITQTTSLQGRWQQIGSAPTIICDTGHNGHGLEYVARQLKGCEYRNLICIMGFSNDKRLEDIIPLFPKDALYIYCRPKVERAFDPHHIADVANTLGYSCEVIVSVEEALRHAKSIATKEDMIFVGGSNFVVSEII